MTGHEHTTNGHPVIILLSALVGMLQYLDGSKAGKALIVAAACGLVGGLFREVGSWASRKLAAKWRNFTKRG